MKSDIDALMAERRLDALVVLGPDGLGSLNAPFNYFVGGRYLIGAVFKRRGEPAILVHGVMERDAAQATGLKLVENSRWPLREIQQQFPDPFLARVELARRMWTDLGISGRVGVYGIAESGSTFSLLRALTRQIPNLEIVDEGHRDTLQIARETKSSDEIQEMAAVGRAAGEVVAEVQRFLQQHAVHVDTLVDAQNRPLTIGDVKRFIRRRLIEHNLEHPGDPIFAQGRDAGVPHNHGDDSQPLQTNRSIIYDFFPRRPGGYFHDMTRTWCLGTAPEGVMKIWHDVRDSFQNAVGKLKVGLRTHALQMATCDFFAQRGHKTLREDASLHEGYIHGLGHGLGLDVHETPGFPTFADAGSELVPGLVFTIEPGLYYPSRDLGVRLEDTFVCHADGRFESLTCAPYDLVVPMGA